MLLIKEIQNENQWDEFIASNPNGSFLQSWNWGEFQESFGRKVWRLALKENDEIYLAALIIKQDLPLRRSYLYCPKGPLINPKFSTLPAGRPAYHPSGAGRLVYRLSRAGRLVYRPSGAGRLVYRLSRAGRQIPNSKLISLFFEEVRKLAQKEKVVFLRVDPVINFPNSLYKKIFYPTKPTQPQHSLILDISKNEEEILAQMKQKTRYNIRLAKRKGIEIKKISRPNNQEIQTFLNLTIQTSKRDKFKSHPAEYYRKMLKILSRNSMIKLFFAEYQKKVIAANIVVFFSNQAVYLHGASSNEYRQMMAPYYLQWEQIKEAKKLGCQSYDFWGIEKQSPVTSPQPQAAQARSAWAGITRFKKGFGGEEISYPESYDLIFKPIQYIIYRIARKII